MQFNLCTFNLFIIIMMVSLSSLETCSWFCYGMFSNLPKPIHIMKCIGLFKGLHSSTCVVNMYGNT